MLQYTTVMVTNGEHGAFQHAPSHVVALIMAGAEADKVDNGLRVEWPEVGINLKTHQPQPEALLMAGREIFKDLQYTKKAKAVQAEMQSYDPIGVVIENIEEVAGR